MAETEVLIIGCGIAGATAALRLARNPNRQITILTRAADTHESNTRYAQGGIIGRGPNDSAELLFEDIIAAGAGVSSPEVARILANEGPPLLNEVLEQTAGVVFDHDASGAPVWGQEAAHSRRRILHVGDVTGRAIHSTTIAPSRVTVATSSIAKKARCIVISRRRRYSRRVDSAAFTATRRIRLARAVTVWRWPIVPARASRTRSTCSFIPRRWRRLALKVC